MSYFQSLSVFLTVVEEGSFSAAAKRLSLTQPTISFHIDNLEKNFGCPLFTRTTKGVHPTVYGNKLHDNLRHMNELLHRTRQQLASMVAGTSGKILLGASSIPGDYILPGFLADFLKQNPDLKVCLQTGDSQSMMTAYREGLFPIVITGSKPAEEVPGETVPLWSDELVLAAHPDRTADGSLTPQPQDILKLPFIMRKDSSASRQTSLAALRQWGVEPSSLNIVLEIAGNEAMKSAMQNNLGVGFISRWAIRDSLASGRLVAINLPGLSIRRRFYATGDLAFQPPCVTRFWQYLLSVGNQHPFEEPLSS
ncbi:MAG TPA: LysR family transcriptional regulator [Patescibacteria group bacterium]|nr:LysR family transcriptional regulator [Patescibacteria group bacterium]